MTTKPATAAAAAFAAPPAAASAKAVPEDDKEIDKIAREDKKLEQTPAAKEVAEAVATADPLDNPDFNPLDYINRLFPNGIWIMTLRLLDPQQRSLTLSPSELQSNRW